MLKITEGGLYSLAKEKINKEICALTERGERVYLIVPEQKTVSAEKEMSELLPPSAPLYFEATNFTRLANTVFRSLGGVAGEYADKAKNALVMWKALTELSPFLSMTGGKSEVSPGLVTKALSAVAEIEGMAATTEELLMLVNDEKISKNKRLSSKLSDISKIMTLYKSLLSEKYCDTGEDIDNLVRLLDENPDFLAKSHFFIEGFTSFTEPQYKLLKRLMKQTSVNIYLPISRLGKDSFEYTELCDTKDRLIREADTVKCDKKLVRIYGHDSRKSLVLSEVCDLLWSNFGVCSANDNELRDAVRIFEANDPYEECDFIASDIKKRVMAGEKYRDFAIVARNAEEYTGIIDSAMKDANIPAFHSRRKSIFAFDAIKLIYTALEAICEDFERESVISYMKCGLSGIAPEACDEFELYTEKWQITKKRFYDGIDWNMRPEGYDKGKDSSRDALISINNTRKTLIEPLISLKEELCASKTVREYSLALMRFITHIGLESEINRRACELRMLSENELSGEYERLFKIICDSLDTLVDAIGECEIDTRGFINQLKTVHSFVDIGSIPAFYDEVTVGSADMLRISEKKHVYLIGVNHGEFPRANKDTSFFTERDRILLLESGLHVNTNNDITYARELFAFSRAFAFAREDVTLLYSLRDSAFAPSYPSDVIARIKEICKDKVAIGKISEQSIESRIYTTKAALDAAMTDTKEKEALIGALTDTGFEEELELAGRNIRNSGMKLSEGIRSLLYSKDLSLTQTRIDTYVSCPLSYYLRYDLKLSENEKAEFDARNIGTFIHAILENFFTKTLESKEELGELSESRKEELVRESAKKYLNSILTDGTVTRRESIMLDRLCRAAMPVVNGLCDEFSGCKFKPRFFELKIGNEDPSMPSPAKFKSADGGDIFVYGSVDRVDTYESEDGKGVFVRVIDYKTGAKNFSPDDMSEGKNLQMFLYLRSIVESNTKEFRERIGAKDGAALIPAGVIYVKTDMNDVIIPHGDTDAADSSIKKKQERRGMILDDAESIYAMNTSYIPVKFKKDGSPDSRYEKYLYSYDGWNELTQKISDKVSEISTDIKSGNISASKDSAPCSYCKFKPICRSSKN